MCRDVGLFDTMLDYFVKRLSVAVYVPAQSTVLAAWRGPLRNGGGVFEKSSKMYAKVADHDGVLDMCDNDSDIVQHSYNRSDYIVVGSSGRRYPMKAADFGIRYEYRHPEPPPPEDALLAREGFMLFTPIGKVWAYQVTLDDMNDFFPAQSFFGKIGTAITIEADDYLAMPFPSADEVYCIPKKLFHGTYRTSNRRKSHTEALEFFSHEQQRRSAAVVTQAALPAEADDADAVQIDERPPGGEKESGRTFLSRIRSSRGVRSASDFALRKIRDRSDNAATMDAARKSLLFTLSNQHHNMDSESARVRNALSKSARQCARAWLARSRKSLRVRRMAQVRYHLINDASILLSNVTNDVSTRLQL